MFDKLTRAAQLFDTWRVMPRILIVTYCWFVGSAVFQCLHWYFALPAAERTMESAGFATFIVATITAPAKWIYDLYAQGGRAWAGEEKE